MSSPNQLAVSGSPEYDLSFLLSAPHMDMDGFWGQFAIPPDVPSLTPSLGLYFSGAATMTAYGQDFFSVDAWLLGDGGSPVTGEAVVVQEPAMEPSGQGYGFSQGGPALASIDAVEGEVGRCRPERGARCWRPARPGQGRPG